MRNFNTLLGRNTQKINESISLVRNSSGKLAVLMLFLLTSVSNLHSQYCLAATTNVAITPSATSQTTAVYSSGCRAFNFVATVGCTYTFATCGLSTGDTYLRLYSTGTGGSVLVDNDDYCNPTSSFAWVCPTAGTYSVLLTNYSCIALSVNTSMSYIRSCPENTVPSIGNNAYTLCSGVLYDHAGSAGTYAINVNGYSVINPATVGNMVRLSGTTAGEGCCDYLNIYNGTGTTGTLLWSGIAGFGTVPTVTSTSGPLTVQFTSDGSVVGAGFALNISCVAPATCSGTPAAGTATITSATGCPNVSFTLNSSGLSTGTGITYQWQTCATSGGTYANVGAAGSSLTTSTATTAYYKLKTTCSGSGLSNYTNVVSYTVSGGACTCIAYPASTTTTAADDEIFNVTVGTLNNSSICTTLAGGAGSVVSMYSNYSGIVAAPSLTQSSTISGSVTIGFCSGIAYSTGFAVYIDYNQNGVFTDAGEMVYSPNTTFTPAVGGSAYPFTFTVPAGATLGTTRMRIVDIESTSTPASNATTYQWGETEDYCVTITSAVLCSGTPAPGLTIASPASVSSGVSSILTLTNATAGSGVTYNWQSSATSGGTYVNVVGGSGAATASYTTAGLTTLTWFRCQVTCGANTGTSTQVQVAVTPIANALSFDGSNDRVTCGQSASINITGTTITLEAWIYPTAWQTNYFQGSIINREINASGGYMLRCGASGTLSFNLGNGGSWYDVVSSANALTLNTWQHVAGTYDGTTLRLFKNGVLINSSAQTITIAPASGAELTIGNWSRWIATSDDRCFIGLIDEARIWSVTKSAAELVSGMTQTPDPSCATGLRASYSFDQGIANGSNPTVTTLFDATANANNGTLSNMTLSGTSSNWVPGKSGINPVATTVCSGTPTPGNTTASSTSVTSGTVVSLGLQNATCGSGVTYNWQSSATSGGTYMNVVGGSGATTASYTTAGLTTSTWFRSQVICGANTGISTPVQITVVVINNIPATGSLNVTCGSSTLIYDDGGSAAVYSNSNTGYLVLNNTFGSSSVITLSGTYTGIEACCDHLNIYDGVGVGGSLLYTYGSATSGSITTFSSAAGQTITIQLTSDASLTGDGIALNAVYSGSCVVPVCSGTPSAGTATITSAAGCPSVNFTLNSSGLSAGMGISYLWESSPNNSTWSSTGITTASYTISTATTMYYRLKTTCSGSGSINTTNVVSYTLIAAPTSVTATPNSICAGASTNLNAITTASSIAWYTVSTGGTAIGSSASGVNFPVTPSVSTTYYAASTSNGPSTTILNSPSYTSSSSGNWTLGYSFTPNTNITVTSFRRFFGSKISIWTDAGVLVVSQAVTGSDGTWTNIPLVTPVVLNAGTTYRIASFTNGSNFYWSSGLVIPGTFTNGTITNGFELSGDAFPSSSDGIGWFVDLNYSAVGCESTRTSVAVTVSNPVITTQPTTPANICGTGTATTSIVASNAVSYQWFRNGMAISALPYSNYTTSTLTITNPSVGENGAVLTCVVYAAGASCPVTSLPVSLVVGSAPAVPSPVNATNSAICVGQSSLLNATSAGNYINWYSALTGGTLLTTVPSATDYSVTPIGTTTYYAESIITIVGAPQTANFAYTGAITTWTVPAGVSSINIDCMGAQGGSQPEVEANYGGRGARIVGNSIAVTPGQVIKILVGQAGTNGVADDGCGGGGGSFVTTSANVPLVIAGGGGGDGADQQGVAASLTTTSTANGDGSVAGSVAPNGGGASDGSGGGGLSGNGANGATTTSGGSSFTNGGTGGVGLRNGGFGGGGAGGTYTEGAGGGGGYAGGPGGAIATDAGGGGSSYCIVSPVTSTATQTGNGSVVITYTPVTFGCTSSPRQAVTVTVSALPIINTQPTTPANICGTGTATTSIVATNAVTYQWFKNGVAISALPYSNYTTSTLTITNPSVGENGAVLTCVVYAAIGSCPVTSLPVSLVVGSMPAAPSPVTATNSAICVGQTSNLTATSSSNNINWYNASSVLLTTLPVGTPYVVSPGATTTYYAAASDAAVGSTTFNYTGSIQTYTVPAGVTSLHMEVVGATGGISSGFTPAGGKGAKMVGDITVTPGQIIKVLAGGVGTQGSSSGGGGGGGSFVTTNANAPLIIAGGGGGMAVATNVYTAVGADAVATTSGVNGYSALGGTPGNYGIGGTAGSGATGGTACGGNGGGLLTNGTANSSCCPNTYGYGFVNGAAGGIVCINTGNGGFGGGGGGGNTAGGGGGGYSGGGASWNNPTNGGGGGSYNSGSNQVNTAGFNTTGAGYVVISYNIPGCTSPLVAVTVTVNTLPIINTQPTTPASFCAGTGTATTSIVASNAVSYQWFKNGVAISALPYSDFTTSILTITNPLAGENGAVLTCVVYAAGGSCPVTSLPVSLVVGAAPAVPSPVTATSSAICLGQSSLLNATSVGNNINWYSALTGGTLLTTVPSATDYSVTPAGTTIYYAESATVPGTPQTATFAYTGAITTWTVPAGVSSVTINAKGASGGYTSGSTPGKGAVLTGTFVVTPGQVLSLLVGQEPGLTSLFPAGGGGSFVALGATYSTATPMIVAGGGGAAYSSNTATNADPNSTSGQGAAPGTAGNGAPAQSCAGGGGGFYTSGGTDFNYGFTGGAGFWQGGAGGIPTVGYIGSYQSGGFGGGAPGNYVGSCNTFSGSGGGYSGGSAQGVSYVYVGNFGGSFNSGTSSTVDLAGNTGNGSIVISYTPVTLVCTSSPRQPVTVTINPPLTASVSIAASATTICVGTAVTFTATPTNGGLAPVYQWKVNGNDVVGANSVTYTNLAPLNGEIVTCVLTSNATPCLAGSPATSTNSSTMTVTTISVTANVNTSTTVCLGTSVTLTGGGATTYSWDNGVANGVPFTPTATTTYIVTGTITGCPLSTASITVTLVTPAITATAADGTVVWRGATSVNFGTASNWYAFDGLVYTVSTVAPSALSNVIIPINQTCVSQQPSTMAGNASVNNITIEASASLTMLNGILDVKGDWVNNGSLIPGTGTVTFSGGGAQVISGSATTFTNLTLNKSADLLTLNAPATVSGTLTMTAGDISTTAINLLTVGTSTSAPGSIAWTGGSVLGPIKRYFSGTASLLQPSGIFPVGYLNLVSGLVSNRNAQVNYTLNLGTGGSITAEYKSGPTPVADIVIPNPPGPNIVYQNYAGLPAFVNGQMVQNYENEGYWEITPGTLLGTEIGDLKTAQYSLKLRGNNLTTVSSLPAMSQLRMIKSKMHTSWDNVGIGEYSYPADIDMTFGVSDFTITNRLMTGFSWFNIGSGQISWLPVTMLDFAANCNEKSEVDLKWSTASEQNSENFIIERSRDLVQWEYVSTVNAAGNSNYNIDYSIADTDPFGGISYYRVVQVDNNGAEKIYGPISVSCLDRENGMVVFPNPTQGKFTVEISTEEDLRDSQLVITDLTGKIISTRNINVLQGKTQAIFENQELQLGTYIVQLISGNQRMQPVRIVVD